MLKEVTEGPIPTLHSPEWSQSFRDILAQCLQRDVAKRPFSKDLVSHPFLQEAVARMQETGYSEAIARLGSEVTSSYLSKLSTRLSKKERICGYPIPYPQVSSFKQTFSKGTNSDRSSPSTSHSSKTPLPHPSNNSTLVIRSSLDLAVMRKSIEAISTVSNVCNDERITQWRLSIYTNLRALVVADGCFKFITDFVLKGFHFLETIDVGSHSFSACDGVPQTSRHSSFMVTNCPRLQTITIGASSFSDFDKCVLNGTAANGGLSDRSDCLEQCPH